MKKIDRTGEIKTNVDGLEMQIIEYKNNKEVWVQFENGAIRRTTYTKFKHGKVYPTWRNRASEQMESVADNYDPMRRVGCGIAIALAIGSVVLGVAIIGGAIYGITELISSMF